MLVAEDEWVPDATDRIIEISPPDAGTFEFLKARGCTKYLGLIFPVSGFPFPSVTAADGARFVTMRAPDEVRGNNADVLILNGAFARYLWYRQVGRARFVAFPASGAPAVEARFACRVHRRPPPRRVAWGERKYDVVDLGLGEAQQARRYMSQIVGLGALPAMLDDRDIRYVVLRWFDQLPELDAGEDLDVLVSDEGIEDLIDVLESEPGTVPVDAYSASGRPGSDFQTMAYYPPALATAVLQQAVRLPNGYSVPSPPDHFASLAYHALYHKGTSSGLPTTGMQPSGLVPEHDYEAVLSSLGERHGMRGPLTMERLDEHLAGIGWRPPRDMLARLSHHNPWVRERFFAGTAVQSEPPLLSAFLLRDKASGPVAVELAQDVLHRHGFESLTTHLLDETARKRCAAEIRGGNWGAGPFATSGGDPAVLVVAIDEHPKVPAPSQHRQHPGLANAHTLEAKEDFRDRLLAGVQARERFNPMHSSDNDEDAWHYIELAHPAGLAEIRGIVEARRLARASSEGDAIPNRCPSPGMTANAAVRHYGTTALRIARSAMSRLVHKARRTGAAVARWGVTRRVSALGPRPATSTDGRAP